MSAPPILVLPGYGDSGPEHWQSVWEAADPRARRVVQRDWLEPRLDDWLAVLDREISACPTPPVLVAPPEPPALCDEWLCLPPDPVAEAVSSAQARVRGMKGRSGAKRRSSMTSRAPYTTEAAAKTGAAVWSSGAGGPFGRIFAKLRPFSALGGGGLGVIGDGLPDAEDVAGADLLDVLLREAALEQDADEVRVLRDVFETGR